MSDLSAVSPIVHQKQIKVSQVRHKELLEAVRQHVASLALRAIADLWHSDCSAELPSDAIVNASGSAPAWLEAVEAIALEAEEFVSVLSDLLDSDKRNHHLFCHANGASPSPFALRL